MYLALRHGRRRFRQDSTCPALLRWCSRSSLVACTGLSPSLAQLSSTFPVPWMIFMNTPTTPTAPQRRRFRLFPFRSPLLWESIFLSLPAGTKMFQFPTFAQIALCLAFNQTGYPIRTSPDQFLFADPRSFSQLTTSFIATGSLGIPRSLLFSFSVSESLRL